MTEYIFIVDNRGPTPKCVRAQIIRRTEKLIHLNGNGPTSGAFGYRRQIPVAECYFNELDAIRAFKKTRQADRLKLMVELDRCNLDIDMCLKTMEQLHENSA